MMALGAAILCTIVVVAGILAATALVEALRHRAYGWAAFAAVEIYWIALVVWRASEVFA